MVNDIRKLLAAHPFLPFTIRTADGRALEVKTPDGMWVTPSGMPFFWEPESDTVERLNPLIIVGVPSPADGRVREGEEG